MKKYYNVLSLLVLSALLLISYSCSKSDDSINEWEMSNVIIQPADYLKPASSSFQLKHSSTKGITGSVSLDFVSKIQNPVDQDINVFIEIAGDNFPTEIIDLSADKFTIKSGKTVSDTISLSITDWTELESIKEAVEYKLKIKIKEIVSNSSNVEAGSYYQEIPLIIAKAKEREPEEVMLSNVKDWSFTFMDGVEGAGGNTVAGTGSSDVATNGVPFWFTVDLKEIKTVTGIRTRHWGSGYAPSKVEVLYSDDGANWNSIITTNTSGSTQTIKFEESVETRFLKYQMIDVPGRVDVTYFYVYSME